MRYSRLATCQEEADEASRLLPLMVDSECKDTANANLGTQSH
ncbi:unnamed protein product [Strongylus vulgaris]|uniref:Uncharacterized protein n=1 Tax=Strongylus vulgaris TaxID=40348 RepID=A0A3P7IGZ6_STRVU|nr:unnamed protein product [Strongylus vulgaris]